MSVSTVIASKFKAVDKLSGPVSKMANKTKNFGSKAEAGFDKADRKLRSLNKRVGSLTGNFSGMQQAFAGVMAVMGGSQVIGSIDSLAKMESKSQSLFNIGKKDAQKFADEVQSLSARFNEQEDQIVQVTNAVSKQMGVSYDKAFKLIEKGYQKGANVQGEFLDQLKEFPGQMDSLGISASQTMAIITQSQRQGFFSDKGVDAIKEAGIALREMPKPAKEAVNRLYGSSNAASQLQKRLNTGKTTLFEEIQKISGKLQGVDAQTKGMVLADVFKGPGEDAMKFVENIDSLNLSLDGTKSVLSPTAKRLNTMQDLFTKVKNVLLRSLVPGLNSTMKALRPVGEWMVANKGTLTVLIKTILFATGAYLGLKAALFLTSGALKVARGTMIAFNSIMGIHAAITKRSMFALRGNRTALLAYRGTVRAVTAVQWAWNAAMNANPIGLIITGVAALIGLITTVIAKWDSWGASVALFMGPLGMVISLIQSFRRHWDNIVKAFKTNGIVGALKAVGVAILDSLLMPIQQLLELVGKLPSWLGGGLASDAASGIENLRKKIGALGEDVKEMGEKAKESGESQGQPKEMPNSRTAQTQTFSRSVEEQVQKLDINVNDPQGKTTVKQDKKGKKKSGVRLTKNQGAFAKNE